VAIIKAGSGQLSGQAQGVLGTDSVFFGTLAKVRGGTLVNIGNVLTPPEL
jgi:hypothetical protein